MTDFRHTMLMTDCTIARSEVTLALISADTKRINAAWAKARAATSALMRYENERRKPKPKTFAQRVFSALGVARGNH